jgi:rod shape-determining protein MreC
VRWLLVSLVIFILGIFNFFAPLRGGLQYFFNPLQFGLQQIAVGIKDGVDFYLNLRQIRSENLSLLDEIEGLRSEIFRLEELEEENKLLKEQFGIFGTEDLSKGLILARTLGNIEDHTRTSIALDRGSLHGISIGDVVVKGRHLVGVVRDVTQQRSEVELITSPTLSISVIDFETKTEGLARGEFGTSVLMGRILPGEQVHVGDTIVTSGRDGRVLPGYLVGSVTEVSEESAEVLRQAAVEVLLNLESLGKVFVIPND